jgi:hypothetical protein
MKNTLQVYVLTLKAPSRKTIRLWAEASIHSLRRCSSKKIDRTVVEMQQHVDDLRRAISALATGFLHFRPSMSPAKNSCRFVFLPAVGTIQRYGKERMIVRGVSEYLGLTTQ